MNYGNNIGVSLRFMMEQDPSFRTVAYFSMEVGLKAGIPTYSGGLGVLAGDILKSAADLGVPMAGVTLLYRKGYFRQAFDDCLQEALPVEWDPGKELTLLPNEVTVIIEERIVKVRAWCLEIQGRTGFTVPVYFLDTDLDGNTPEDRELTWYLYGGDERYRLCQEIILGSGGLRFECIDPYRRWRVTYEGRPIDTTSADIAAGTVDTARTTPLRYEIDLTMVTPAWDRWT